MKLDSPGYLRQMHREPSGFLKAGPISGPCSLMSTCPQIDGLGLARIARDHWPCVAIVVTSGEMDVKQTDIPSGDQFLRKPYTAAQIHYSRRSLLAIPRLIVCSAGPPSFASAIITTIIPEQAL